MPESQNAFSTPPLILAPAGNKESFLAALAAGADAVYCGLKRFSARMAAQNFTFEQLAALTELAHKQGAKVFVTVNTLLTTDEINETAKLIHVLKRSVHPDAIIIQDLSLAKIARDIGFKGDLILSTLANVSFPAALDLLPKSLNINGVVLPRELSIDEVKQMAGVCPDGLKLEIFVHGALCYGVSGRCYWSSYMGGKSGLRGRCVQPCRRLYNQNDHRYRGFSCQDLSLDVLAKLLLKIPQIQTWKIEGRKKGPHYVYYTVSAYKTLRDHGSDPKAKKEAMGLLDRSLGRERTHYLFLPQRPQNPIPQNGQTASGLLIGKIHGGAKKPYLVPREDLFNDDILRIGYEDEKWHALFKIQRHVPKRGKFNVSLKTQIAPPKGTPVFLVDRREKTLKEKILKLETDLVEKKISDNILNNNFKIRIPVKNIRKHPVIEINVHRILPKKAQEKQPGIWLSDKMNPSAMKTTRYDIWWWLPPVIWPDDEDNWKSRINAISKKNSPNFVLNAPWQITFFKNPKNVNLWAGPFCNAGNAFTVSKLADLGFKGVIVSPELGVSEIMNFPKLSPLPLGIVISGNWPLCIARTLTEQMETNTPFISPKGEQAWVTKYESNYWTYPNWMIDLKGQKRKLEKTGYSLFIHLKEPIPPKVTLKQRPGLWNWNIGLS
jgi:putative protease